MIRAPAAPLCLWTHRHPELCSPPASAWALLTASVTGGSGGALGRSLSPTLYPQCAPSRHSIPVSSSASLFGWTSVQVVGSLRSLFCFGYSLWEQPGNCHLAIWVCSFFSKQCAQLHSLVKQFFPCYKPLCFYTKAGSAVIQTFGHKPPLPAVFLCLSQMNVANRAWGF